MVSVFPLYENMLICINYLFVALLNGIMCLLGDPYVANVIKVSLHSPKHFNETFMSFSNNTVYIVLSLSFLPVSDLLCDPKGILCVVFTHLPPNTVVYRTI